MHVDGFRFDLAAILGRDEKGQWMSNYSILSEISNDPILSNTKVIAEGWDAGGLYKVGDFPAGWAEWNGKFRDDIRSFIKGDDGKIRDLSKRISGSPDLFKEVNKNPCHSINFITCHDGFTLYDLVSYNVKHNENNGENNRDGSDMNFSWNCGVEGMTEDPEIIKLRDQQIKNFFVLLMISQGTPMIHYGDEMKFSKKGNNNTYCHDNELNWLNWEQLKAEKDFYQFCHYLIAFRKKHPALRRQHFFMNTHNHGNKLLDINWYGVKPIAPGWEYNSHCLSFLLDGSKHEVGTEEDDNNIYIAINAYWDDVEYTIPGAVKNKKWYYAVNTYENPGYYPCGKEKLVSHKKILVKARSMIILIDK
jgi:glycogen operon protein